MQSVARPGRPRAREREATVSREAMWSLYDLRITIPGPIFGGNPEDPRALEIILEGRGIPLTEPGAVEAQEAVATEEPMRGHNVFRHDEKGLYLMPYQVKAMLKDAASVLRLGLGISGFKARLADRLFILTPRIYLTRGGAVLQQPDGAETRAIHVWTPQGEKDSIKRSDYVAGATVTCTLKVLKDGFITDEMLRTLLEYAAEMGLGADRSQGGGVFRDSWEIEEVRQPER